MNDMIIKAAQDPSCILAVTPDRGGSWWATLRPDTPRNFAEKVHAFYDYQTVVQEALDPTHDYSFLIEAEIVRENHSCPMFYAGVPGTPFGVYVYSDNTIRVFSNLLRSAISTSSTYVTAVAYSGDTLLQGRHTIEVRIEGDAMRVFLDGNEIEHPYTFARTGTATVGLPTCNSGYVYKIQIEDLTTGETIWKASHDELYETNNPWPSPVPRNFDDVTAAWYDAVAVGYTAIGDHDCEFEISYKNNVDYPGTIFYSNSQAGSINLHQIKNNQNTFSSFRAFNETYPSLIIPLDAGVQNSGSHIVKFKRQNGTAEAWVDGQLVKSVTSDLGNKPLYAENVPASHFDGNIFYIRLTDLTTGRTVWSYPSEAERVRLLTKTNVRTDRGVFEAADETKTARIDTVLDLRGKVSSYTVVVDFEAIAPNGTQSKTELAGQGASVTGLPSICALAQSGFTGNIQLSQEINGSRRIVYKAPNNQLGRHVAVGVVDVGNSSTRLAVYYDGDLLAEDTFDGLPAGTCDPRAVNWAIFDNRNGTNTMRYGKIYSALLFDRALTAAEIAALTPKKQPLSWAGIRDVVRRGRAQRYFAVGDVLTVATPRWTIEYEVVGFDQVEPADAALTHSMTLLPVRLVTNLQFDAPEPGNPDANRAQYGCNRWDWSAIRQWLNSTAAPGEWWTAQHEYDVAPDYAATMAGFMTDLPADFLSAVAPARIVTALPNADGGGSIETVDRFWLPSRTEIFGVLNDGIAEGVLMTKYVGATDADRIKYNAAGNSNSWFLRSANTSQTHYVAFVEITGIYSTSFLVQRRVAAACIIA